MTDDEFQLLSDIYIARTAGLFAAVTVEYAAEAERLTERGWLERRVHEGELVYSFTDEGVSAVALAGLNRNTEADLN